MLRHNFRVPGSAGRGKDKKLPVFIFPEELQFLSEDESAHKQVLTLYNPYEFNIRFQVLSNAPYKYTVIESQGSIKANCCVDIVVRHKLATQGPFEVADKFRIDIYSDKQLVGRKQLLSRLLKGSPLKRESSESAERSTDFKDLPYHSQIQDRQGRPARGGPGVLMVLVALACLLVLLLPLEGEGHSWPHYSHITVNQKLIAAFALGLVTMALLKS